MKLLKPAVAVSIAAAMFPASGFGQQLEISLRLNDSGQFSTRTLRRAERYASDILATAGVRAVWIRVAGGASADIRLNLVDRPRAGMDPRALGYTDSEPLSAAVVAPMIKGVAIRMQVQEAVVLGVVIAHEVGHLLGVQEHADEGIMATDLTHSQYLMAAQGALRFTTTESQRIKAAAESHLQVKSATSLDPGRK